MQSQNQYTVVIRAGSRLRFDPSEQLAVNINARDNPGVLVFRTRYSPEGFESSVPRELWIEARGQGASLREATDAFTIAAMDLTTIISFCANGSAGECQFHLAYESTPGKQQREFLEQFVEDERGLPLPSRRVNPQLTASVIEALYINKHSDRILRAIVQYVLALDHWKPGSEILSTAHLFMGMEALVRVALLQELDRAGLASHQELADAWGIELKELDSTIRRNILFEGDADTHRDAKKASDGIEHGFLSFTEVRPLAQGVRDKTAAYLRRFIVKLLGLSPATETDLLSRPYDRPIGTIGYVRYFRGELISDHDQLASADQEYPLIDWKFTVQSFSMPDRKLSFTYSQNITPRLGDGVSLRPLSFEMYGPEGVIAESSGPQKITPEVTKFTDNTKWQRTIGLLDRIEKLIMTYNSDQFYQVKPASIIALTLYSRCRGLFQSILILLRQGLLEEALLLARSLWIDALNLAQIADSNQKEAMALKLLQNDARQTKKSLRKNYRAGRSEETEKIINSAEEQRLSVLRFAKRSKFGSLQALRPYQDIAVDKCSLESYRVLLVSEQLAARSILVSARKSETVGENTIALFSHSDNPEVLEDVGGLSAEGILLACRSVATILQWDDLEGIEDLEREVRNLLTSGSSNE